MEKLNGLQSGAAMVKSNMRHALLLITLLCLTGCNGLNRLLGTNHRDGDGSGKHTESESITFIVAGQSNCHANDSDQTQNYSHTGMVEINRDYLDPDGVRFIPTRENYAHYGSAMIKLGDELAMNTNKTIKFVFVSIGATTMQEWKDNYYRRIVSASEKYHPTAILWIQGEGDVALGTSQPAYYAMLKTMIDQLRSSGVVAPFYCAQDSGYLPNPVAAAQSKIVSDGFAAAGPELDTIRNNPAWMDTVHFINGGTTQVANRWFDVLRNRI